MEILFDESDIITRKTKIEISKGLYILIKDEVEGDIELRIVFKRDSLKSQCFNRYRCIDSHKGEIQIYNAPDDKNIRTKDYVRIGTYAVNHNLFMGFRLGPVNNKQRDMELSFLIKEK